MLSWGLESAVSFAPGSQPTGGVLGNPAIVADVAGNIYFANIAQGTNPTAGSLATYNVAIGSTTPSGTLRWYQTFPELIVGGQTQTQINLVIGTQNDLYVSFTTPGSTPNNFNMTIPPIFCACYNPGSLDIVVARLTYTNTSASVVWVLQNARINSCSNDYSSALAIDPVTGLLYVALETHGTPNCSLPIGMPNILLSCFTLSGTQLWLETQTTINGPGQNRAPSLAADSQGGVYLAYTITQPIQGGYPFIQQQVEMVKFQTTLTPSNTLLSYGRQWVLSDTTQGAIYTANGASSEPCVTQQNNQIFLCILTSGSVDSRVPSGSLHDVVVCSITPQGEAVWLDQGLNNVQPLYQDAAQPYITTDTEGDVIVSFQAYTQTPQAGDQMLFVYSLSAKNGVTTLVLPVALTGSSSAAFPSAPAGSYSRLFVAASNNTHFTMALGTRIPLQNQTLTSNTFDLALINYTLYTAYPNITPFQFMTTNKQICSCGARCTCS